jgi:protein-S-isoprenylcysteine O-methyltransferase Ste14
MHLIGQTTLGILILILLGILVVIKRVATGSIIEKLKGGLLLWLVNIFNLFFLLIANPLAAILLINEKIDIVDPGFLTISNSWILLSIEIIGLIIYFSGFALMAWALIRLGVNYQLGGVDPRANDNMVTSGPYKFIRHPMYTAAVGIALGLSMLLQSIACFGVFFIYLFLIILLIPKEERSLTGAYGESYRLYQKKTKKLIPIYSSVLLNPD